ncbi:MAG: alpha/beta hydrolase [Thermodesulfobacteriota bacterium]|nr:alpha/beta hydrolase [Thermodesulfobacteriota bacterium]
MRINAFLIKCRIFFSFLVLLACLNLGTGCDNTSSSPSSNSANGSVSGTVVGVDPSGAVVSLLDSSGEELAGSTMPISSNGVYHLQLHTEMPASDEYLIARVTRNGRSLRALVTGFSSGSEYEENDTFISPDTEAAVRLCSLGQDVSIYDYALFLRSCVNGVFEMNLPDSSMFPYREIMGELSEAIAAYFDGDTDVLPSQDRIAQMIISSNNLLGLSLPANMPSTSQVRRAFMTPDGNAQLIIGYDPTESGLTAIPIQVSASSHEDDSFRWNAYQVDLGNNILKSANMRIIEKHPLGATAVFRLSSSDTAPRIASPNTIMDEVSGTIEVAISNVSSLIDPDSCGLVVQEDNVTAPFVTTFNQDVHSNGVVIRLGLQPVGGKTTLLETIPVGSGKVFASKVIDLTRPEHQDRLIIASIAAGSTVLYAVEDFIDLTRYQPQAPMLVSYALRRTRANSKDMYNNLLNSHDVNFQPVDAGNVYSHYILDLDRLLRSQTISGWKDTQYGSNPPGDGHGRIPLIFVHGWQGDVDYRSAARLSDWKHSPVLNLYGFISFYMGSPELNQKYHIYVMHWPSYKHIDFSGNLFSQLLHDVQVNHPETDLGMGMNDPETGVVVMTHSTGGLIARNAIETHLAFADESSKYGRLRKAILLASPNHGTPMSVNTWPNNWRSITKMDVGTQATADLEWDSFDDKSNLYFSLGAALVGHHYSYKRDRSESRWPVDHENVREFDLHYLNVLGNMKAATYNPWLLWFTRNFSGLKDVLSPKYILYSGWTRIIGDAGNFVYNSPSLGYTQTIIAMAGYHNDSVLPVCSNLMATSTGEKGFYLPAPDPRIAIYQDWYPDSTLYGFEKEGEDWNVMVIGNTEDHPLGVPFRVLWDYDHIQIRAGALSSVSLSDLDRLIDEPVNTDVIVGDDFWKDSWRIGYLRGAVTYNTGQTPSDEALHKMTNRLKTDPLFLMLEKDLLDVENYGM